MKQDKNDRPSGVSRRTVVKGAAWAVPAITVASAVPAAAASGRYFNITGTTVGCKISNNSVYHLEITIESNSTVAATIEDVVITGLSSNNTNITWPTIPDQCMCPGDVWVLVVNSAEEASIASFGASISWAGEQPITLNIPARTPDCNADKTPPMYDTIYDQPLDVEWIRLSGADCAGCP